MSILIAAGGVAASPTIWNIIARNEYRNGTMTRLFGGKYPGCYVLAAWIFFSSLYRDYLFELALRANKEHTIVASGSGLIPSMKIAGAALIGAGTALVVSAFYRLGITGTYLGDYFGILMKERVTKFPFSHFENPMYLGSTMCFLGMAVRENSMVGVGLSAWVHVVYQVSTQHFENPFTDMIYRRAAEAAASGEKKSE